MTHPNEDLVRSAYAAFGRGDMEAVFNSFTDDIVFHVPGQTTVSGEHRGKDELSGFFQKVGARAPRLEIHDVLANDEHVASLLTFSGEPKGKPTTYRVVHVWHVRAGKLAELWEHPEQADFDAFWS